MFRSFFPTPKLFFLSAAVWLLVTTLAWYAASDLMRGAVSLDRFLIAPTCIVTEPAAQPPATEAAPDALPVPQADGEAGVEAAPGASAFNCVSPDAFLTGERLWLYQFVLMVALVFCAFWYVYERNEWYWWSVFSTTAILVLIYFNVQVDAFINNWQGSFFNTLQMALSQPGSVDPAEFYGEIGLLMLVLTPRILVLVLMAFYTSHYVFRWRKAMNFYYMRYWQDIRTTEGAAQRVQEDTMRFASIMEDLGSAFFDSLITLVVFLPILWSLSQHITQLPIFGDIPGSLVWVALVSAALGTVLLASVGVKLPGLQFENQKVEAAYRKELVFGEDQAERADPPTIRELFANVQTNYFRIYWHYTYFNIARYGYLQLAGYIPLLALSPSILAGVITLGVYQQVQQAFGQVASSFQFLARAWTTVIELLSVHRRLRRFESFIPADQEPIKESVSAYAP